MTYDYSKRFYKTLEIEHVKVSTYQISPLQNAVVALNELRPGLEYRLVEQRGPTHLPMFVMEIEVNGQIFKAEGR